MNRNQQAERSFSLSIIEDDLVLRAQVDEDMVPLAHESGSKAPQTRFLDGIPVRKEGSLADFKRSRKSPDQRQLEELDQAVAEIGRRATNGFATLLELPVLLAMALDKQKQTPPAR